MSASQIIFFEKNKMDLSDANVAATASQGSTYVNYALNRNNTSAWVTSGSVDADNTTYEVDMVDPHLISDILLLLHNFKAFTVKYWDGAAYQDFSPAISQSGLTGDNNVGRSDYFEVTEVSTTKLKITITGTLTANSDKFMAQFIATRKIGQLNGWPVIKDPTLDRNKVSSKMLSGKLNIAENIGSFKTQLNVKAWRDSADLTIVESLYAANEGFLVWLCGGDETQFFRAHQGYRKQDIFLMKCVNNYQPEMLSGVYKNGLDIKMDLSEVVD